ncbi:MAG: DPP IV N-terminal domain-containing protein [Bacteroidaceae bacterium]|nr:DPP IV N-terminal domain-containing protein [Bacteroidaceae bacterium]
MRRIFAAVVLSTMAIISVFAQQIKLQDILSGRYAAQSVKSVRPMGDGETYSCLSDDWRKIERRSFKTGEVLETLFDADEARGAIIRRVEGYIVSPDEKNILIETNHQQIYRRSYTAIHYIYNIKNKTLTPLSEGGPQECPKFSPDGNQIAFVRDNNIFLVKLLFNNAESQITKDGERNKIINGKPDWVYEEEFSFNCAFDFSADGEMLAWIRFDESAVKTFSFPWYKGTNPSKDEYALYPGTYEYKYPKAGEVNAKVSVMTYDIKSRVTRTMQVPLDDDGYIPRIQFTGEKDKLMVLTLNRHQNRLDFYAVNARSTTAQLILREEDKRYVDEDAYADIDFSGDQFVMLSERDGHQHMYLYSIGGQLIRQLTSGEYEVLEYYGTDASGKNFYFASNEGSPLEKYIYKVDASGKKTKLSTEKGWNDAVFSDGCQYYLNTYSNLTTPPVYTLCNASGKAIKTVEDNADLKARLASLPLGSVELISVNTADGIQLNGWMVKPKSFDPSKQYPVIMYQYGGPGYQMVFNSFDNGFMRGLLWEQHLAEKGYIVVCVDGRGTGGRGSDFKRCTYMKLGDLESRDQVETAVWLGKLPYVDKSRIAIWGWSFGGFNTIMSMCEGRAVFNCGVAVAPVTDWRFYDTVYTERFMRTPQENPTGYDCSPLHRYQQLQGDLLLIHGMADDNVHFQNSAELAEALVQSGHQFDMQFYTNRNHSIYGGNTRHHLITRIENFLDAHLLK